MSRDASFLCAAASALCTLECVWFCAAHKHILQGHIMGLRHQRLCLASRTPFRTPLGPPDSAWR